jgi:16S rRNA (cytidine1402-2'-O)-methyltransferase
LTGTLHVVATPIGNLADASPRALDTLKAVDLIACEDTRTTRTLLARYAIATPTVALHAHNERAAAAKLIALLREGKDIALVSDAGTPTLSDPGAGLVAQAHRAGIRVSPVPGPSAAAAAFSAAGFPATGFFFAGFLPARGAARKKALAALDLPWPVVLYEAPHRIADTIADLAQLFPGREVVVCRELTKKFEEVARLPLGAASSAGRIRPGARARRGAAPGRRGRGARARSAARGACAERSGEARRAHQRRAQEPPLPEGAGAVQVARGSRIAARWTG